MRRCKLAKCGRGRGELLLVTSLVSTISAVNASFWGHQGGSGGKGGLGTGQAEAEEKKDLKKERTVVAVVLHIHS